MTLRIAVLGLGHETNTFSRVPATQQLYEDGGVHRGTELVDTYLTSQATFAGFLADPDPEVELVPLLAAWINPCGAITPDAYDNIVEEMLALLEEQGPFDGVLLGLHGAAVAEHEDDVDGDLSARVRQVVGADVPVAAVIDMHANVSERIVAQLDLLFPYQTNPHVDARARGLEAKTELLRLIRTGARPGLALVQLPLVVTITKQDTDEEPMSTLLAKARKIESEPGVIDASIVEGFPYADVAHMGMSVVVSHDGGHAPAQQLAALLAEQVWARREELQGEGVSISETMRAIDARHRAKPLLVLDVGDNVGGGGPGDSTALLWEAHRQRTSGVVGTVLDPEVVAQLASVPIGERVSVHVGAKKSAENAPPLPLVGTLIGRSDGRYEEPKMAHGGLRFFDAGASIALETEHGMTVVVCSKLVQPITPHQLTNLGLDPLSFRAIFAKGVNGPRAGFAEYTDGLIVADTPGITRLSVQHFDYRKRRVPLYPFEPHTTFPNHPERTHE